MNPYAEWHEIGYVAVGSAGLVLTGVIFLNYAIDLIQRYRAGTNGVLRLLAWQTLIVNGFAMLTNIYMQIVAVSALASPPRPFTQERIVAIVALYMLSALSVGVSLFTVYARGKVAEELRKPK